MSEAIKLFVGCAPNGEDAESQMVLEYTARKHSSMPIEITWMKHSNDPMSFWYGWNSQTWATPFSGFRWGIPAACGYKGQAIYCDSDFVFLSDLADLWNQPFEPGKVGMVKGGKEGWRTCLTKWNCEEAGKHFPPLDQIKSAPTAHQQLMAWFTNSNLIQPFEGMWNTVDGEDVSIEQIDAHHYSSMNHQHHLKYALPRLKEEGRSHWFDGEVKQHWREDLEQMFDSYYQEAMLSGMKPTDYYSTDPSTWVSYSKESLKDYGKGKVHNWVC